jgi:hypothetical protein
MAIAAARANGHASAMTVSATTHVEGALGGEAQQVRAEAVGEDEPAGLGELHAHAAALALEEADDVAHRDAAQAALAQQRRGEALAAVVHGDHDLLDAVAQDVAHHVGIGAERQPLVDRGGVARRVHVGHDAEAALVDAPAQSRRDGRGAGARAPDQHAALEPVLVDEVGEAEPQQTQADEREDPGHHEHAAAHVGRRA